MNKEIKEIITSIVEKNFSTSIKGYKKNEVDEFLDEIIEFLENINTLVEENNNYIDQTTKSNLELKTLITKLQKKVKEMEKDHTLDELVIEKKIKTLEKNLQELKKEQNIY